MVERKDSVLKKFSPEKGVEVDIDFLPTRLQSVLSKLSNKLDIDWTQAYNIPAKYIEAGVNLVIGKTSKGETARLVHYPEDRSFLYVGGRRVSSSLLLKSSTSEEGKVDLNLHMGKVRQGIKDRQIKSLYDELLIPLTKVGVKWGPIRGHLDVEGKTFHGASVQVISGRLVLGGRVYPRWWVEEAIRGGHIPLRATLGDITSGMRRYVGSAGKDEEFRRIQEDLRTGGPSRLLGGPGFYEKYLKGREKPWALYHITPRENLESIKRKGLSMGLMTGRFMGKLEPVSRFYLSSRGPHPVVLEIDTRQLDPTKLRELDPGIYRYEEVVDPKAISEFPLGVDYPTE